jgi:general secretion pathway protein I
MKRKNASGFTLLEIMIAVAVFAIVSAALVKNAALTVRQTRLIEEKTIAYWIAENQLTQIRAARRTADSFPGVGSDRLSVNMADRDWDVVVETTSTENEDVRRVEVSVYPEGDPDRAVASLTGFVGRY